VDPGFHDSNILGFPKFLVIIADEGKQSLKSETPAGAFDACPQGPVVKPRCRARQPVHRNIGFATVRNLNFRGGDSAVDHLAR
jgi:hypothetical protein